MTDVKTEKNARPATWTPGEVKILRELFRNNSNRTVAVALDRTPKAVERKASKLGLTKTKKYLRSLSR